ncbi:hypothetical protein [Lactiplantibacillus plantarum]|uniref:hypothetical protein n=1 Tax=Lactiplantibacillus plantarum TaxID=1590 RepID=UPI000930E8C0|nr:hypothetical protein [Lactiplantibacillus plantarum]
MEVSHTLDGYWVLSGYPSGEPNEDVKAIMKQVKQDFVKANPLIDASKVVVVNGEFKQANFNDRHALSDLAKTKSMLALI